MGIKEFLQNLRALEFKDSFNPYCDVCPTADKADAPKIRTEMLERTLEKAVQTEVDSLWLGRDLGYRGGRRTGLALTDEYHLMHHGRRWGVETEKATINGVVQEQTARAVWELLELVKKPVFAWNVYPLHPFPAGTPFANRAHTPRERRIGEDVLRTLIDLIQPMRIVAIGNDAGLSANRLSGCEIDVAVVRHPSYGGRKKFRESILELYGVQQRLGGIGERG